MIVEPATLQAAGNRLAAFTELITRGQRRRCSNSQRSNAGHRSADDDELLASFTPRLLYPMPSPAFPCAEAPHGVALRTTTISPTTAL